MTVKITAAIIIILFFLPVTVTFASLSTPSRYLEVGYMYYHHHNIFVPLPYRKSSIILPLIFKYRLGEKWQIGIQSVQENIREEVNEDNYLIIADGSSRELELSLCYQVFSEEQLFRSKYRLPSTTISAHYKWSWSYDSRGSLIGDRSQWLIGLLLNMDWDPVVVFGNFYKVYILPEERLRLNSGNLFCLELGFSYALNERLSISTGFSMVAGEKIPGGEGNLPVETLLLTQILNLTYFLNPHLNFIAGVTTGINDEAPDFGLRFSTGISF